jgi:2-C-methyl-D-erythritol 4-phosphate cytidylyltransferase
MVHRVWGIIIASGKGEQLTQDTDIAFLNLGTRPVITYAMEACERCPDVDAVAIVTRKERMDSVKGLVQLFGSTKVQKILSGGTYRHTCVQSALSVLEKEATLLVVLEASRPCVTPELISETIKSAKKNGTGVAGVKMSGIVKYAEKGKKTMQTLDGESLWTLQSPQAFKIELLAEVLKTTAKKRASIVDEAMAFDLAEKEIHLVSSFSGNIKVESADDLVLAAALKKL